MIKYIILVACLAASLNSLDKVGDGRRVKTCRASTKFRENQAKVIRYQMECVEQTRVDPDSIVKIKKNRWSLPQNQDSLVKEWALCVLMKSGIMTKEGVYKADIALKRVPAMERHIVEKQIDKCLTPKPVPAPEIAYRFIKCFQRHKSNHSATVSAFQ
uniref:Odorant binding protein n=1 Tax=Athetis dissimilis TaxID=1737331 RepID=A0A4D6Q9D7_ATHDI|nr:odorant binding protein [Athetis dissimilis]